MSFFWNLTTKAVLLVLVVLTIGHGRKVRWRSFEKPFGRNQAVRLVAKHGRPGGEKPNTYEQILDSLGTATANSELVAVVSHFFAE